MGDETINLERKVKKEKKRVGVGMGMSQMTLGISLGNSEEKGKSRESQKTLEGGEWEYIEKRRGSTACT